MLGKLFQGVAWLAARMSPGRAYALSRRLARLLKRSDAAEVVRINLRTCFPELSADEVERLTEQRLHNMAYLFFEMAQLRFWSVDDLLRGVEIEGEACIDASFNSATGTLLLVPHLGNWELLCAYLGENYSVAALYDPPKQAGLEAQIKAARERFRGRMFPIGVAGMRSVLKELKAGGLVALLPDQVPDRDAGEHASFFGHPALTMTLPQELHKRTGCNVIYATARRQVKNRAPGYVISFSTLAGAAPREINQAIEASARAWPEQYQWEYKRFKRPPEAGKTNIYRQG